MSIYIYVDTYQHEMRSQWTVYWKWLFCAQRSGSTVSMAAGVDTTAEMPIKLREVWSDDNHTHLKSSGPSPDHKQASKQIKTRKQTPPSPVAQPSMASSPLHCIQGTLRHPEFQHNGEYRAGTGANDEWMNLFHFDELQASINNKPNILVSVLNTVLIAMTSIWWKEKDNINKEPKQMVQVWRRLRSAAINIKWIISYFMYSRCLQHWNLLFTEVFRSFAVTHPVLILLEMCLDLNT